MSVAELGEVDEVRRLIARGQQVGVLTYVEIATAAAELDLEESDVEELHGLLERCEIELVEEIDPAAAAVAARPRVPRAASGLSTGANDVARWRPFALGRGPVGAPGNQIVAESRR